MYNKQLTKCLEIEPPVPVSQDRQTPTHHCPCPPLSPVPSPQPASLGSEVDRPGELGWVLSIFSKEPQEPGLLLSGRALKKGCSGDSPAAQCQKKLRNRSLVCPSRVTSCLTLPGPVHALAIKVLHFRKLLRLGQTGTVGHPTSYVLATKRKSS